jgi:hypothetical protein
MDTAPTIVSAMNSLTNLPPGMTLLDKLHIFAGQVGQNNFFIGMIMIFINIASRHVDFQLSESHKRILSSNWLKYLLLFAIVFSATRDMMVSFLVTIAFIVVVMHFFNEKSKYCILPKSFLELDTNHDGVISPQEIKEAYFRLKAQGKID